MKSEPLGVSLTRLILVVTIMVALGALLGAAGYLAKNKQEIKLSPQAPITPEPAATPTPIIKDETADWKTYRNEEYGFEVKYPQNLETEQPVREVFIIYAPSGDKKEHLQIQWLDINTILPFTLNSNGEPVGYKPNGAEYVGKKMIGGKESIKYYTDNPFYKEENDLSFTNYILKLDNREWVDIGYHGEKNVSDLFEKIISTFKFIKSAKIKNAIIYPNKQTVWKVGETYSVRWTPKDSDGTVDIRLNDNAATNNATRLVFQASISPKDTGDYPFTVFKGLKSGNRYQFVIGQYPSGESLFSEEFIIVEKDSSFSCGTSTVKDIDNNIYNTVQIDSQCWLKENLKVTKNPAGEAITRYCYDNDPKICDTDGGLYDWNTAMNNSTLEGAQGICPNGWHIPRDLELYSLENYLLSNYLSAGYRNTNKLFTLRGSGGHLWSSTEIGIYARNISLGVGDRKVIKSSLNKAYGFSVRCLKD